MAPSAGTRIGPYEVTALVGQGGMGEVYRATDTRLKRTVAIKVLPPSVAADPDRLARFQREAEVLASLNHPNIAAIYGLEEGPAEAGHGPAHSGHAVRALVMELVEGPTLADRLAGAKFKVESAKSGRVTGLPVDEALAIATQIAEALEAAHEQGIIHRDLKPANIKVRPDGTVKVLDFGLAKLAAPAEGGRTAQDLTPTITSPALMTGAGMILGTAAYMSPEQARGKAVDRRADIWAFGCVLFEMLTGARPFGGEDVPETLAAVLRADPDWSLLPASTPPGIRRLLRLCLDRDPRKRLQSAADARIRLTEEPLVAPAPSSLSSAAPSAPRRHERVWQAVAVACALVAVGLGVYVLRPPVVAEPPEQRTEIVTPPTPDPNSFAISSDGRQIVFVASSDGAPQLWVRSLAETIARPLPDTAGATYPFWSPDARAVAFFAEGRLKRLDIGATRAIALATVVGMRGGTWGADGTILFAQGTVGPLLRLPASGGASSPASMLADGQSNHRFPAFLPDGRRFLYFALGAPETQGIYLGSLESLQAVRLTSAASAGRYLPGGWLLWMREGVLVAQQIDVEQGHLIGEPVTVTDQLTYDGTTFVPAVSVSADGSMVYRTGGAPTRELRWFDPTGKPVGPLSMPDDYLINPRLSPDGTRALVFRTVESNSDIWLIDSVRASRLTSALASDQFPIWAPDGSRFVFRSNPSGRYNLFVASASSQGTERVLLETAQDKVANDWSSDGKYLAYQENDPNAGSAWNLWAMPLEGSREPFQVLATPADERGANFSPDGRWLAYYSNQSGRYEVYVRPFLPPGAQLPPDATVPQWQISSGGGVYAKWRRDGRGLYYQSLDGQILAVPLAVSVNDVEAGVPYAIFRPGIFGATSDVNLGRQWDVAPDGRFLVNALRDVSSSLVLIQHWKPPAPRQ
jgi:serine/threonine protein kinase